MSICKLIYKELQNIQESQIDPQKVDTKKYDLYIKELTAKNQRLEMLSQLAKLSNESLEKIDAHWRTKSINVEDLALEDLFVEKQADINDTTIVYQGLFLAVKDTLSYPEDSLPGSLSIIQNFFGIQNAREVKSINFDIVGNGLFFRNMPDLEQVLIRQIDGLCRIADNNALKTVTVSHHGGEFLLYSNVVLENLVYTGLPDNFEIKQNPMLNSVTVDKINANCYITENLEIKSVTAGNVGKDIRIDENLSLEKIKLDNVGDILLIWTNASLKELQVGDVSTEMLISEKSEICNNPLLETILCGHFENGLLLNNNPKLTLESINSIHEGKVKILGYLVLENQFSQYSNEEILQKFDVEPDNIIRIT